MWWSKWSVKGDFVPTSSVKNKWLGREGRTFVEDSEVLRHHSYQTGREADFDNSSFWGILPVMGISIYFICCFSRVFFPFLLRGSVEKMLLTLTKILSKQVWFFCFGTCILWLKNKLKNFWNRIEFLWYSCRLREIGLSQYSTNWSNSCILKSIHSKLISFSQILCAGFTVVVVGQFSLIRICMTLITILIKLFDNSFIERRKIILVSESYVTLKVTG